MNQTTNTQHDLFDIADFAVRIIAEKLKCDAKYEGVWDDMYQSAYAVCLEIERKGVDRHREYYIKAAKWATQGQCIWLQSWNKHNHKPVKIERHTHESELSTPPEPLPVFETDFCSLCRVLYSLRKGHAKQSRVGALADAKVVYLVLKGYTNKEIGTALGVPWVRVADRRQRIRRRLEIKLASIYPNHPLLQPNN